MPAVYGMIVKSLRHLKRLETCSARRQSRRVAQLFQQVMIRHHTAYAAVVETLVWVTRPDIRFEQWRLPHIRIEPAGQPELAHYDQPRSNKGHRRTNAQKTSEPAIGRGRLVVKV